MLARVSASRWEFTCEGRNTSAAVSLTVREHKTEMERELMVFVPLLRTPPDGEGTRDCHLPPLRAFISVLRRILKGVRIFINTNSLRSVANVLRAFLIQSAHVQHLYTRIMQLSLIIEWHIYILPDPRTLFYNSCHVVKWHEMRFRRVLQLCRGSFHMLAVVEI